MPDLRISCSVGHPFLGDILLKQAGLPEKGDLLYFILNEGKPLMVAGYSIFT
jgi:hypothetical protein